jgi:hypothetical protein
MLRVCQNLGKPLQQLPFLYSYQSVSPSTSWAHAGTIHESHVVGLIHIVYAPHGGSVLSQVLRKLTKAYIRNHEIQQGLAPLFLHHGHDAFPEVVGEACAAAINISRWKDASEAEIINIQETLLKDALSAGCWNKDHHDLAVEVIAYYNRPLRLHPH